MIMYFIFKKMRLKKILDTSTLQGFQILQPDKEFKKLFPKKFIYSIKCADKQIVECSTTLPNIMLLPITRGYIFTYTASLPKELGFDINSGFTNSTYPECLDQYFPSIDADNDKNVDLILKCNQKSKGTSPPCFVESMIIRSNSHELLKGDISKIVMKMINNNLSKFKNTQDWVKCVIDKCPMNEEDKPLNYPKIIDDKNLNGKVRKKDMFIEYDYRPSSLYKSDNMNYDYENKVIVAIEDAFEDPNMELEIRDNYGSIVPRMLKALKTQKLPYKYDKSKAVLKIKKKTLRELKMEYDLTDFI